jgi:hypothetical protein
MLLPIQSSHLKLIRQSEVYIMEEAVTDTLIKSAVQRVELLKIDKEGEQEPVEVDDDELAQNLEIHQEIR